MADPMKLRASLQGDTVEVKVLMAHAMETGQRKDAAGATGPAHYIRTVTATCNGRTVLAADWGPSVARNPFLAFRFTGAAAGDRVAVTWRDSQGETRTDETTVG